jgi:hypothetical protein
MAVAATQSSSVATGRQRSGRWARVRHLHARMRQHAREGGLPCWRQAVEMLWLKATRDVGVHYYQTARMWRRDMPWAEKLGHLGTAAYERMLAAANPIPYRKLSQHKLAEKALLTILGVATPRCLGFAHPVGGRTPDGAPLETREDFESFIAGLSEERVCFKLMEGHSGSGFVAARIVRGPSGPVLAHLAGHETLTPAEFYDRYVATARAGRLVEAFLDQHAELSWFNETSVNTLRILVYAPPEERARVVGAYLRIGRRGSIVDNHGAGGILAGIDLRSGVVGTAYDAAHQTHTHHPDTGRAIEGRTLPYWSESMRLAERTLDAFPMMRFAGFDIAVTPTGPAVIEINNFPGTDGVACTNMQLATMVRE